MARVSFGLGSNLGDKVQNLHNAIYKIENRIGPVLSQSDFIQSEPVGFISENNFTNAVIIVETSLSPTEILQATKTIEIELGRTHKSVSTPSGKIYSDRIIDIDILLYDDISIETEELTIPHPLMQEREFVMIPLRQAQERLQSSNL